MPKPRDAGDDWPRRLNRALLIGAATIALVGLLGGVLTQADTVSGDDALHLQLEYFAVFAAVSIFFLSSAKYVISRERVYLGLGLGFLGSAIFDLLHPLIPSGPLPASTAGGYEFLLQDANGYLWWLGRISFGIGFLSAALAFRRRAHDERPNRMLVRGLVATAAWIVLLGALVAILPLPAYYGPGGVESVMEVLPLLLYLAAAYIILQGDPTVEQGLRLGGTGSLLLGGTAQVFAALSDTPGDGLFFAAHAFKITSYFVILFGLYLEHVSLYAEERKLRRSVEDARLEALRRRSELFAVIENTADGIAILDAQGTIQHLNRAAQEILQADALRLRDGVRIEQLVSGETATLLREALDRCLKQGEEVRDAELLIARPGRPDAYVSLGLVPLRAPDGAFQGAVADFHDVTRLRQAERRYRELAEGAPDGILEVDEEGRVQFFNQAGERVFGFPRAEVIGQPLSTLIASPVELPRSKQAHDPTPRDLTGIRKSGREFPIEVTVSRGLDPEHRTVTLIVRDMQQLEKTRREKAGLVAIAQAVNATNDARSFCHQAATDLCLALGYEAFAVYRRDPSKPRLLLHGIATGREDSPLALGMPRAFSLEPPEPSLAVHAYATGQTYLVSGRRDLQQASPRVADLGIAEDSLGIAVPVHSGDDVIAILVALGSHRQHQPVQERNVLEYVALQFGLGLGHKLLFEELQETAKNLSITNRELDAFIYTASHDLAEPLRTMSNFSQFLLEDYASKLDDHGKDYARRIHEGALRMRALLDALLQVSRIRHKPLPFEHVEAAKILREAQEGLDAMIRERKGEIVVHEPMPRVWAQPTRLVELFTNLLSNALKFNESKPPRVDISAAARDGVIEFQVKDNGIGIPAKYQDRVFGLFTRLHARNQYPGTGAGLAIVRTIVEQHGGEVRLESTEGVGTTVIFTLPVEPRET